MEILDCLIRTLTYKRSCLELDWKNLDDDCKLENQGVREGLSIAITECYKLLEEFNDGTYKKE